MHLLLIFIYSAPCLTYIGMAVGADIPDDVVLTEPSTTLWLGDTGSKLTCAFSGVPYAVFWLKGTDPASAETLITWYKGTISGARYSDRSLNIDSEYSLEFVESVTAADEGTYVCRVSNHRGHIRYNNTQVRVLDPNEVVVFTEPAVLAWKGNLITLPCDFQGTPIRVLWNKHSPDSQGGGVETVLRYSDNSYEVLGSGLYRWSATYGLIIPSAVPLDGGNFTCIVEKELDIQLQNSTMVSVNAHAVEPYIRITNCYQASEQSEDDKRGVETCIYDVTESSASAVHLECSVLGAKPEVGVTWTLTATAGAGGQLSEQFEVRTELRNRSDGTFDTIATVMLHDVTQNGAQMTCTATGEAVGGSVSLTASIKMMTSDKSGRSKGATIAISLTIAVLTLLIAMCVIWLYVSMRKKRRPHPAFCCVVAKEKSPEMEILQNEAEDPLKGRREKILAYTPGEITSFDISEETIKIGLYGVMAAGKSALINSLLAAVKGEYSEVAIIGDHAYEGGRTCYRDPIRISQKIEIQDHRGLQDFSLKKVNDLINDIRGKKGGSKTGTHCPVFVANFSQPEAVKPALNFIRKFSEDVFQKMGRYPLVVITHKNSIKNIADVKKEFKTATSLPTGYIHFFENFTNDILEHETERSSEYLDFIWQCLEIGERNIHSPPETKRK